MGVDGMETGFQVLTFFSLTVKRLRCGALCWVSGGGHVCAWSGQVPLEFVVHLRDVYHDPNEQRAYSSALPTEGDFMTRCRCFVYNGLHVA